MAVDIVAKAFERADKLSAAKQTLYEQLAANRRFLRDLDLQELLTPEQSTRVQELYPPKRRGNNEETEE